MGVLEFNNGIFESYLSILWGYIQYFTFLIIYVNYEDILNAPLKKLKNEKISALSFYSTPVVLF
jgi:hypothetical protein